MPTLQQRQIVEAIAANGKVDSTELQVLRDVFYTRGQVKRDQADLLVELFKRIERRSPAFEEFFYRAIKDHVLDDGKIDAEETAWLRRMLLTDGACGDRERKFLHELRGEATQASPEFDALYEECMKQPSTVAAGGR
jgi:hypothetical protein